MARVLLIGLIQSIKGRVGDKVFFVLNGRHYVRQAPTKMRNPNTPRQRKIRQGLAYFGKNWNYLTDTEQCLWGQYAKMVRHSMNPSTVQASGGLIENNKPQYVTGIAAYNGINMLLYVCDLQERRVPPLSKNKPPTTNTNLGEVKTKISTDGKIRFKIWLPYEYPEKCISQIWMMKASKGCRPYLAITSVVETTPKEITIETVRVKVREKMRDVKLTSVAPCAVRIQMRTIAENGLTSATSAVYRIRLERF